MSLIRHTSLNYDRPRTNYHAHTYPVAHTNSINHQHLQLQHVSPYVSYPHHYHSAPLPQYNFNAYRLYYSQQHHHHYHNPLYHTSHYNSRYPSLQHQHQQQRQQQQQQHDSLHRQAHNKKYSKSEASSLEHLKSKQLMDKPDTISRSRLILGSLKSTVNWIAKTFCFCFTDDQLNGINFDANSKKIIIK